MNHEAHEELEDEEWDRGRAELRVVFFPCAYLAYAYLVMQFFRLRVLCASVVKDAIATNGVASGEA